MSRDGQFVIMHRAELLNDNAMCRFACKGQLHLLYIAIKLRSLVVAFREILRWSSVQMLQSESMSYVVQMCVNQQPNINHYSSFTKGHAMQI